MSIFLNILKSFTLALFLNQIALANDSLCESNICFETKVNNPQMSLLGVSKFKYLFFDVYVAALYAEVSLNNQSNIFDPNKSARLIIKYLREIRKEDFIQSTKELVKSNKTIDLTLVEQKFIKVYEAFEDVRQGDSYRLDYIPWGQETCLFLNDEKKICQSGSEFYKAFFGIWISSYSVNQKFTAELLGKSKIN